MGIISWFKKKKSLKSFVYGLGPILARRYGQSKAFSPDQVIEVIKKYEFNNDYLNYAMAMYLEKGRFGNVKKELGVDWDYDSLRKEIADKFFKGNLKFTGLDMTGFSKPVVILGVEATSKYHVKH
jgi:hypothetical protein